MPPAKRHEGCARGGPLAWGPAARPGSEGRAGARRDTLRDMLRATIRQVEVREVEVAGDSLEEVHAQLSDQQPGGFELVNAPVKMTAAGGTITATGTYHRRDVPQEITAATREELAALVPEGWIMLHVQSV